MDHAPLRTQRLHGDLFTGRARLLPDDGEGSGGGSGGSESAERKRRLSAASDEGDGGGGGCCGGCCCGLRFQAVLSVLAASCVAMLLGYDIGVMSAAKRVMARDIGLSSGQIEVLVGSLNLVSAAGGLLSGAAADSRLGRRGTVALACATSVAGSVAMAAAPASPPQTGFGVLMAGRTLCGIAVGSGIMIAPLYISELAPRALRGGLVSFFEVHFFSVVVELPLHHRHCRSLLLTAFFWCGPSRKRWRSTSASCSGSWPAGFSAACRTACPGGGCSVSGRCRRRWCCCCSA
eukprot:SAG22_NODE_1111_length_5537_cov_6.209636_5_plen_291_part_00